MRCFMGAQAVIVDPKAERGRWKETLPEISHEINIVPPDSMRKQRLTWPLCDYEKSKDSESLAIDILTFLRGFPLVMGNASQSLEKAIRANQ